MQIVTRAVFLVVLVASPALAKEKSGTIAALAIAADAQSAPSAVNVSRIARDVYANDADLAVLDLEKVLDEGEPLWVDKIAAAEAAYKKGRAAKDAVELPVAADAFAQAIVAYEQAVPGLKDIAPVVDALAQQAAVLVLQGDAKGARSLFVRALALDPAFRVQKEGTPPRVFKEFEAALKEDRGVGQGTLTVYSTTGAAEVWVDGVYRGIAPFTIDIGVGRHYVRVARDGYVAWGTAVEVKRGSEASVQASPRPTKGLAKLEDLGARAVREPEASKPIAELAAALKVDRLLAVIVKEENGTAQLNANLVDGVNAQVIGRASKAFATKDSFFDHDVKQFLDEKIRRGNVGPADVPPDPYVPPKKPPPTQSLLPGAAEKVETPGAVVGGWVMIGLASALAVNTAVCGSVSLYEYDLYRNKLPTQLDPQLKPISQTWLTLSIITDASWIVGAGAAALGTTLLVNGYAEMDAQQEVVNP